MLNSKPALFVALGVLAAAGAAVAYTVTRDEAPEPTVAAPMPVSEASPAADECVPAEARDERRIAGTVIGAVVGGAVGRDVGDRDVTTAAGAAAGAIIGNQAQKKFQENRSGC